MLEGKELLEKAKLLSKNLKMR